MIMADVPILETPRLILRGHRAEDFEICANMWKDPDVVKYTSRVVSSREASWTRFLRYFGHWQVNGFGYWVLENSETGEFLGEVGFADYKRDMEPSIEGCPEAGWVLASAAHGNGYASEAVKCITQWADNNLKSSTTVCIIDPEHHASIRVADKAGYKIIGSGHYFGDTVNIYERTRVPQD